MNNNEVNKREKEFYKFLDCKIDLMMPFSIRPSNQINPILFKEEFTFDNWLNGIIGKRLYKTGFKQLKPSIFGAQYNVRENALMYGFEYSIYRFVNYNFKLTTIKDK